VDFVFNLGTHSFAGSTLLRLPNAGDFNDTIGEFAKWDHAGGQLVAGLLRRRTAAEAQLFQQGMNEVASFWVIARP